MALLEADVHFGVVRDFVARVREQAVGQEVLASLSAPQQVLRVMRDEMIHLLGDAPSPIELEGRWPAVVLMAGLSGSGKTTTSAKLGKWLAARAKHPALVSADVRRPAAIEQLAILADQAGLKCIEPEGPEGTDAVARTRSAKASAADGGFDVLIVDTAGRLHVDPELMDELRELVAQTDPIEVLFVADSMTGQDATQQAETFHEKVGIDGVILTKLDGDTRGGAAISIRYVTGRPILFAGIGEKLDNLEIFHPDRMASRILGMGDVLTLVEKAQAGYTEDERKKLQRKIRKAELNFNDFLEQMKQVKNMGGAKEMLAMLPGMGGSAALKDADIDEKEIDRTEAIIYSMTKDERERPAILNGSRRRRIAEGSGSAIQDVNQLLKSFDQAKKIMKKMGGSKFTPSKKDRKKKGKKGSRKNSLRSLFR